MPTAIRAPRAAHHATAAATRDEMVTDPHQPHAANLTRRRGQRRDNSSFTPHLAPRVVWIGLFGSCCSSAGAMPALPKRAQISAERSKPERERANDPGADPWHAVADRRRLRVSLGPLTDSARHCAPAMSRTIDPPHRWEVDEQNAKRDERRTTRRQPGRRDAEAEDTDMQSANGGDGQIAACPSHWRAHGSNVTMQRGFNMLLRARGCRACVRQMADSWRARTRRRHRPFAITTTPTDMLLPTGHAHTSTVTRRHRSRVDPTTLEMLLRCHARLTHRSTQRAAEDLFQP